MLEARSLTKCYASLPAVNEVSFTLRPDARLALFALAASGALVFAVVRRRSRRGSLRLVFDEQPEPAVQELGLVARE